MFIEEENEAERQSSFKVSMNEMPIQPTHDVMFTRYAISGGGLLIPLGVDTIVTR